MQTKTALIFAVQPQFPDIFGNGKHPVPLAAYFIFILWFLGNLGSVNLWGRGGVVVRARWTSDLKVRPCGPTWLVCDLPTFTLPGIIQLSSSYWLRWNLVITLADRLPNSCSSKLKKSKQSDLLSLCFTEGYHYLGPKTAFFLCPHDEWLYKIHILLILLPVFV